MQPFGKTQDGKDVSLYTLKNKSGMTVKITNYGGVIQSISVPDRNKKMNDVVLGFDSMDGYLTKEPYFGAVVGRYANRIAKGTFKLDGKQYHVPVNDGPNALHGGIKGFDKRVWEAKDVSGSDGEALLLTYVSADGEEGYPGTLTATVKYTVTDNNELRLDYGANTDKDTVLNLTNHSYFNLAGAGTASVLDHKIMIAAEEFTPIDGTLIPTGKLEKVAGTPLDFTKSTVIGSRIDQANAQLKYGKGYDHNFVLHHASGQVSLAARVEEPTSGRVMEVSTDQPGIQFYTGNFLDGTNKGKGGKVYQHRSALCLETQHFPDSPNKPMFPTTVLKPGEHFHATTIFAFKTE